MLTAHLPLLLRVTFIWLLAASFAPPSGGAAGLPADPHELTAPVAGATPDRLSPMCLADGREGRRVQVVYASLPGTARQAAVRSRIDAALEGADATIAAASDGTRRVRFVTEPHGSTCGVVVDDLTVRGTGYGDVAAALQARGLREDRVYLVLIDARRPGTCGQGAGWPDDRPGSVNDNDRRATLAVVHCWTPSVTTHELMHALGAVQASAPHATSQGHCTDGHELLCYADGSGATVTATCPLAGRATRLDCGNDDYFAVSPPPGSYLATHWNTADSSALEVVRR